jgi:hypothetical protein
MPQARRAPGRIFINYRRDDTGGAAGRLSDSLERYFGPDRVFRDVGGIEPGANFEDVLQHMAEGADAMIVLIGRHWTRVADDAGQARLHDPSDWVAREIASAIERRIPIYPVLVESAVMPRADELPASLKALTRFNAISISDQRWVSDVTRLARIVAIDIPGSLAERTLAVVQGLVSLALTLAIVLPALAVMLDLFQGRSGEQSLYSRAASGVPFVVVSGCVAVLLLYARLVDLAARRWLHAAAAVGLAGTFGAFVWAGLGTAQGIDHPQLPGVMFFASTTTAAVMLAVMNLSRFKAQ